MQANLANFRSDSSWTEHRPGPFHPEAVTAFQKRVKSEPLSCYTLYFINVYHYDFSLYPSFAGKPRSFDIEVTLYPRHMGSEPLSVSFSVPENSMGIEDIESQVETIWTKLDCQPDLNNND